MGRDLGSISMPAILRGSPSIPRCWQQGPRAALPRGEGARAGTRALLPLAPC